MYNNDTIRTSNMHGMLSTKNFCSQKTHPTNNMYVCTVYKMRQSNDTILMKFFFVSDMTRMQFCGRKTENSLFLLVYRPIGSVSVIQIVIHTFERCGK